MDQKVIQAWELIRQIMREPASNWGFKSDEEKAEWIRERFNEMNEAREKMGG